MIILEDLREVVRVMREFQTKEGPTFGAINDAREDALHAAYQFVEKYAAQIEQDARDAERYRWLRANDNAELLAEYVIDDAISTAKESVACPNR